MSILKKIGLGLFSLVLITGIIGGLVIFNKNKEAKAIEQEQIDLSAKLKELGQNEKKVNSNPNKNILVLKIGDTDYSLEKVLKIKFSLKVKNPDVAIDEVIDSLKTHQVLLEEAKKRGIYPSKDDVMNYIIRERKSSEEASNPDAMDSYLEGLGITRDQYWNAWAVPHYEEDLAMSLASKDITKDIVQGPTETPKEYITRKDNFYKEFVDNKKTGLKVQVLRQDLLE